MFRCWRRLPRSQKQSPGFESFLSGCKEMDSAALEIDGSVMEGGGQILRVSAALSCITGSPIRITKIRAGRSSPGLRPQHLSGLQLVSDLCSGSLQGASIGSTDISLTPGKIHSGTHTADTHTAGSVCLLLQVALPCALYADASSQLLLKGGTNAEMAPQIDYTVKVHTDTHRYILNTHQVFSEYLLYRAVSVFDSLFSSSGV